MKPFIAALLGVLALTLSVTGCRSQAQRSSMPAAQSHYSWTITHAQGAQRGFLEIEQALAQSYNSLPAVLKLRQPETGTFILRPLIDYTSFTTPQTTQYTLTIHVTDTAAVLNFDIGTSPGTGYYPPSSQIPMMRRSFRAITDSVASSLQGEIAGADSAPDVPIAP